MAERKEPLLNFGSVSPLFNKMDALLARHRGPSTPEDIPVLTEEASVMKIPTLTEEVRHDHTVMGIKPQPADAGGLMFHPGEFAWLNPNPQPAEEKPAEPPLVDVPMFSATPATPVFTAPSEPVFLDLPTLDLASLQPEVKTEPVFELEIDEAHITHEEMLDALDQVAPVEAVPAEITPIIDRATAEILIAETNALAEAIELAEARAQAEATRIGKENARAEAARIAEENARAEATRIAEENARTEATHIAEENARAEAARIAEENARAEAARIAEENARAKADIQAKQGIAASPEPAAEETLSLSMRTMIPQEYLIDLDAYSCEDFTLPEFEIAPIETVAAPASENEAQPLPAKAEIVSTEEIAAEVQAIEEISASAPPANDEIEEITEALQVPQAFTRAHLDADAINEITAHVGAHIAVDITTEVAQLARQHFTRIMNGYYQQALQQLTEEISRDLEAQMAPRIVALVRQELRDRGLLDQE